MLIIDQVKPTFRTIREYKFDMSVYYTWNA